MKVNHSYWMLATVVLLLLPICLVADDDDSKAAKERAIEQVGNAWVKAQAERDVASLNRILADDYLAVGLDGRTMNKQQHIELSTAENLTWESVQGDNREFRVYQRTAVETGRSTLIGTKDGQRFKTQMRYIHVWVLNDNRWQPTVSQLTLVK